MSRREKRAKAMDEQEILNTLQGLRDDLNFARMQFNQAVEPELVDACVYEISALQARYNYFLRLARETGLERSYAEQGRPLAGRVPD